MHGFMYLAGHVVGRRGERRKENKQVEGKAVCGVGEEDGSTTIANCVKQVCSDAGGERI